MTSLDRRRFEALVGVIVALLVAGAATVGVRAALGAFSDEYQITASTTRTGFGLDAASAVKIRGISVGSVDDVRLLADGTVELTLAIDGGIRIPRDATASIEPVSVFGPKFVDIDPGPSEQAGPFVDDGGTLGAIVEPSELTETLDAISQLLDEVDPEELTLVLTELSRGVDGLGPQLGETLDATADLAARLSRSRPALDALLADAGLLVDELARRAGALESLARDAGPLLDTVADNGDPLGDLLVGTSELAVRAEDLVATIGPELDGVLVGLDGGVGVIAEHLAQLPDFVDGLYEVSDVLGSGLFAWERGPGLWGLIGHGIIDFEQCAVAPTPDCPPRVGYHG